MNWHAGSDRISFVRGLHSLRSFRRLATKVDREFGLDFVFAQYSRAYFCFTLACVREGVVLMMMWVGTVVFRWETNDAIA